MEISKDMEFNMPIFDAKKLKDKILISGGGGGKRFGLTNYV